MSIEREHDDVDCMARLAFGLQNRSLVVAAHMHWQNKIKGPLHTHDTHLLVTVWQF